MAVASRAIVLAAVLVLLCAPRPGHAGQPSDQLKNRVDAALRVLADPDMKARDTQRRAALRRIAGEIFDFGEMTRRAVGRHWQSATPSERSELTEAFAGLLEQTYIGRIEQYTGERVVWAGEAADGDHATVRTRLVTKQGTDVPVDYRMHRVGESWRAYDVHIEGVSLIANYRGQFSKILQTSSAAELARRLRAKRDEASGAGGRSASVK